VARLASVERAGYYPTPPAVVGILKTLAYAEPGAVILDPCCGEGSALAALGRAWGATTVGNELEGERAKAAAEQCGIVMHGPIEFLEVEGHASVLFLNPPYDVGDKGQRIELDFLKMSTPWLQPGGWLIFIVPQYVLENTKVVEYVVKQYSNLSVRFFPPEEFERFQQVILFGKRRSVDAFSTWKIKDELRNGIKARHELSPSEFRLSVPRAEMPTLNMRLPGAAETLALSIGHGPMTTGTWENLTSPRGLLGNFQPVIKPLPGHAAGLIMDGKVDGTSVTTETDHTLLLKGSSIKVVKKEETTEKTDSGAIRHRTIEREKLVTVINALNLSTGEFKNYNSEKAEEFEEFLRAHQDRLIAAVENLYPPLFVPKRDMARWMSKLKRIHGPAPLANQPLNGLLPKQAECAAALAELLKRQKCGLLVGECGVGKTAISLALQGLSNGGNFKVVVMAPGQTAEKWAREAERVLQEFGLKAHVIGAKRRNGPGGYQGKGKRGKPILDIIEAMEEPNPSLLVMSFETAKNGPPWEPAFNVRTRQVKWVETTTEYQRSPYGHTYPVEVEVEQTGKQETPCCPDCGVALTGSDGRPWPTMKEADFWQKKKRFCLECNAPLFTQLPFKYGGRIPAAQFLNRKYAGLYSLIIDEAHNTKARDTDIGQASMNLISAAREVIGMTGTIYDGKASGVFAILYRLLPEFRQLYDFSDTQKFVEHHGLQERITTGTEKASDRSTGAWGYDRENVRVKEIPGVTPAIISWILRMAVFIRKEHVSDSLPSYQEFRVPVEVAEDQKPTLCALDGLHGDAVHEAMRGKPSLLSQWLYAATGAIDFGGNDRLEGDKEIHDIPGVLGDDPTLLTNDLLPKDAALLDLVKREFGQGRGVGIFFSQVNRRDWTERIRKLLEREGIYSEILKADTCKKADREAWYHRFVKRCQGKKQPPVLLLSGSLSYEGLDFIEMPTLVETGIDFQLVRMLQRDQRAHRITQTEPCKVFFLYYKDTFQEKALSLVAAKAGAARRVDGKLIEGLAAMNADEDLMGALIKAAMSEERPRVTDWGELEVEEVLSHRPTETEKPKLEIRASVKLDEVGNPTCTGIALVPVKPSTHRRPEPVKDFQQLTLF
jgi:hypothetical protein